MSWEPKGGHEGKRPDNSECGWNCQLKVGVLRLALVDFGGSPFSDTWLVVVATTTRFFASCFLQRGGESAREKLGWYQWQQQQPILESTKPIKIKLIFLAFGLELLLAQPVSRFGISDKEKLAVAEDDKNNTTTAITGRR